MQRVSIEEEQPFGASRRSAREECDFRSIEVDNYSSMEKEKEVKGCFLSQMKDKYQWYFVGLIVVLLVYLVFEIAFKEYLIHQRTSNFEHNLQLLGKYQEWKRDKEGEKSEGGKKLQFGRGVTESQDLKLVKITQKKQEHPLVVEQSLKNEQQIGPLFNHQTQSVKSSQIIPENPSPSINTQLQFDSTLQQDNLKLSINTPDPVFSAPDPSLVNRPVQQFPILPYKIQKDENDILIDYANYTGITISQVTNSLNWMQLKFLPLLNDNLIANSQRQYYQQKYQTELYQQLPICVVIPTFNNAANNRHINNMNSILMQEYRNFHIVFIDDASTDSTFDDIAQLMTAQTKLDPSKYLLIRNKEQMHAMHNLRMAANSYCEPQDIFMIIDGDDELIGRQVFKLFNAVFQQTSAWFVYSNFLTNQNFVGFSRLIPKSVKEQNSYRQYPFVTSHLRAFYTQLFRNIREQDLRDDNGEYFRAANDVAICLPILEQSQERVAYVPELTYYYNSETGMNNHYLRLKQQKRNDLKLRKRSKYGRLGSLFQSGSE